MMTQSSQSQTTERTMSETLGPVQTEEVVESPKTSNTTSIGPGETETKEPTNAVQDAGNKTVATNLKEETEKLVPTVRRDMNRFPEKSGKSIVIHQPYELISKVLVKHFDAKEDMKFDSFLRKLYRWGFSKKTADEEDGDEEGAHIYIHNHFQKSQLDECINVVCTSKPASSRPPSKRGSYNMYYSGYQTAMPYSAQQQPMIMMNGGIYQHTGNNMIPNMNMGSNMVNSGYAPPTDRASMELMMTQRDRREREMQLLQQQMTMRNGSSSMSMMNYAGGPSPYYSAGGGSTGIGPSTIEAARLGDDINRFERRLVGFQQTDSMTPGLNSAPGPAYANHSDIHRRVMMEAQAGLMRPGSQNMPQPRHVAGARDEVRNARIARKKSANDF
eukprot:scaffold3333_cov233-Chaetoceros_neogracile.AAC.4